MDSDRFDYLAENLSSIWFCRLCLVQAFPFQSLNDNQFRNMLSHKRRGKLFQAVISTDMDFIRKCNVCDKSIRDVLKATSCNDCKHLIHRKCLELQPWQTTDTLKILNQWCCKTCRRYQSPFYDIDDHKLSALTFNSSLSCPRKGNVLRPSSYAELLPQRIKFRSSKSLSVN